MLNVGLVQNLRIYIEQTYGLEASNRLFHGIDQVIIHSLKSVQNVMINDRHCFECYGYDILIDADLKPWLVEVRRQRSLSVVGRPAADCLTHCVAVQVNASPSLSTTTESDRVTKLSLLRDIYNIVAAQVPPSVPE